MLFDIQSATKQTLQALINEKVFENVELEYKDYTFTDGKMADNQKVKLMKEIVAFANKNGGIIIIGMQEDDNRFPTNLTGASLTLSQYDEWLSAFRQLLLSKIRPHLHGVEAKPVELDKDEIAIVLNIPKSYTRPHSYWDGNKDEFYIRYANGISFMDIADLRQQFIYSSSITNEIRSFRKDRISLILANEIIGDMGSDAKLVLHIIPEWSFELGNSINLKKLESNTNFRPISGSSWDTKYNADGFCIYSNNYQTKVLDTYTQIFHNGIIEAVEIRLLSGYKEKQVFDWIQTQGAIIDATARYKTILAYLKVPKPWHIFAAILNAKDYFTSLGGWNSSNKLDRDIINSLDSIWDDEDTIDTVLKPVLDSLSNAFGFSGSSCYDKTGKINYKDQRFW